MKVELAKDCGFCFGVRRAIEMADATVKEDQRVCSLGPIIHNPQVIARLKDSGLHIIERIEDIPPGTTVIIRSHGIHPEELRRIKERGLKVVDATCPLVRRAQQKARMLDQQGYAVVVVGDPGHPEVQAIMGQARSAVVINRKSKAPLDLGERIGIIAQTTQSWDDFRAVVKRILGQDFEELRVFNTICEATVSRQKAALEVARRVDVMLVLGGYNSANTRGLARLCGEVVPTYHIETSAGIDRTWLVGKRRVGVTAGASTPDWIIDEVVKKLKGW